MKAAVLRAPGEGAAVTGADAVLNLVRGGTGAPVRAVILPGVVTADRR